MKKTISFIIILTILFTIPLATTSNAGGIYDRYQNKKGQLTEKFISEFDALVKEGYGQKKYDRDKGLPIPEVERPLGTGIDAYTSFLTIYGDMANDPARQMEYISAMPDDEFFAIMGGAGKKLTKYNLPTQDSLMNMVRKKLDLSVLYNLDNKMEELNKKYPQMTTEEGRALALEKQREEKYITKSKISGADKQKYDIGSKDVSKSPTLDSYQYAVNTKQRLIDEKNEIILAEEKSAMLYPGEAEQWGVDPKYVNEIDIAALR